MQFKYFCDKETKGTFRFQPDERAQEILGQATIYVRKTALPLLGVADPKDGLLIEVKGATDND